MADSSSKKQLPPTIDMPSPDLEITSDYVHSQQVGSESAGVEAAVHEPQRLDDYELLSVLGRGAFATVYLAKQVSLGRQVALKVSENRGNEARTLASLEHDHIVRVFSEQVVPEKNLRLMCMQFISGTTLERVLAFLRHRNRDKWTGRSILEAIDLLSQHPALLDLAAFRDREWLGNANYAEAVSWIGSRLAAALAHAHSQGVLHRDIKPANILFNRYGRPFLADFNVSLDAERIRGALGAIFGGTPAYMAPEHLDAFSHQQGRTPEDVNERSDIYSLGVVLFEVLTGQLPFPNPTAEQRPTDIMREMAAQRRVGVPSLQEKAPVPEILDWTVRRCLQPVPERRYPSATYLAQALEGCREHQEICQQLPPAGFLTRLTMQHPFLMGAIFGLLPQLVGSVVNITYNSIRIVDTLTESQRAVFNQLVLVYNVAVYPACLAVLFWFVAPIYTFWRQLSRRVLPEKYELEQVRRRVLRLPVVIIALVSIGWLPGSILFPLLLDYVAGPLRSTVYIHFFISFAISGLIALTYSLFVVQFIVLRVLYPRLWLDTRGIQRIAADELGTLKRRLWVFQLLAGVIPLAGAVLMIEVGPEEFTHSSYQTFRWLVTGLIALGMAGFIAALTASRRLNDCLIALTGSKP
ncbi:MAG: serine/threonine-protein kinase [Gemmataceae bacterium]